MRSIQLSSTAPVLRQAANDNHPYRDTLWVPHNGGCSTTSGYVPVSVARTGTRDTEANDNMQAGLAVNEYALRVAA